MLVTRPYILLQDGAMVSVAGFFLLCVLNLGSCFESSCFFLAYDLPCLISTFEMKSLRF